MRKRKDKDPSIRDLLPTELEVMQKRAAHYEKYSKHWSDMFWDKQEEFSTYQVDTSMYIDGLKEELRKLKNENDFLIMEVKNLTDRGGYLRKAVTKIGGLQDKLDRAKESTKYWEDRYWNDQVQVSSSGYAPATLTIKLELPNEN